MRTPKIPLVFLAFASALSAAELLPIPPAPKEPAVNTYQGVKVTDDYQWLEDGNAPAVKQWSDAENVRARTYIDSLPREKEVRARMDKLIRSSSIAYSIMAHRGGKLFAYKADPKLQQPQIVTLASADDLSSERVIVDPNAID